jgi:spectinomycin phosphotransferase
MLLATMEELARLFQGQAGPFVICHANLHSNNLLRDQANHMFVIDWDDVMLAPRERDFIFVIEPSSHDNAPQDIPPFFKGYGQTEIDWIALTYYRCERVVQDLIECAQEVFFRDDLEEETRAASVQLFGELFAGDTMIEAAGRAAAYLPSGLSVYYQDAWNG